MRREVIIIANIDEMEETGKDMANYKETKTNGRGKTCRS